MRRLEICFGDSEKRRGRTKSRCTLNKLGRTKSRCTLNKLGQVWVETVVYTLIGLAVIGILLAVSKPKIDEMKDKLIIEQSIEAMGKINDKIYGVQTAPGNRRVVEVKVSEGTFIVDMENDEISWRIDSDYKYSEPGVVVPIGNMDVITREASPWEVTLKMDYPLDLTFNGEDEGIKELGAAPSPYSLRIENLGRPNGNIVVDISE